MKNTTNLVRTICEIGIFAALGFVFDELQGIFFGSIFPSGGSIGFAMIAVLIIAYRRGFLPAMLTGLVMGLFDLATKAYVIHPMQTILDYVFPYMFVGLAGLYKPLFDSAKTKGVKILWLIIGTVTGGLLKFTSHYFAGIFFWNDPEYFAWGLNAMSPYLYCLIYNIAFIGPSIILTGGLMIALYLAAPKVLTNKPFVVEQKERSKSLVPAIVSGVLIAGGAFLFIYFFINWLKSYYYNSESHKYYFNQDSMLIFVIGLFLLILGIVCLVSYFKDKFNYLVMSSVLVAITFVSLIYSIYKIGDTLLDEGDPTKYWIWFSVALVCALGSQVFFVISLVKSKRRKALDI